MKRVTILLSLAVLLLLASGVLAQSSDGYDVSWWTVDGGGYTFSASRDYSLGGTLGQPDAGVLTGGDYTLGGGFWGGGAQRVSLNIYLPVVLRSYVP